jgi:DNA repair/transcription protein MET18/MMS19
MSALQTFMLVVDHDKTEAKQIAERVAQGTVFPRPEIKVLGY